jgi:hypothetical protein
MSASLKNLLVASAVMLGAVASTAQADIVDCVPERVRAANDRVDLRCQGVNRWFIALRSNTDATALGQMLSLLNSSVVTGKTVKIYYNLDTASNGIFWAVELFR